MKRKLLSMLICLAVLSIFLSNFTTVVTADNLQNLAVYVQVGSSGTLVLVHSYTQADLENLPQETQYYSGIDSMPALVHGKGTGVLLRTLIDDLNQYNSSVIFNEDCSLITYATDTEPSPYGDPYTYDYLLGTTRYYYPNLTYLSNGTLYGEPSGAIAVDPMLAITSYQARSTSTNILTRAALDSKTLSTSDSYRLCFGMTLSDVTNKTITANKLTKWIDKIVIVVPAGASIPVWDLNNDHKCDLGDIVMIGLQWKKTGTAGWIPEDINQDGVINVGDVVTTGFHWGESW